MGRLAAHCVLLPLLALLSPALRCAPIEAFDARHGELVLPAGSSVDLVAAARTDASIAALDSSLTPIDIGAGSLMSNMVDMQAAELWAGYTPDFGIASPKLSQRSMMWLARHLFDFRAEENAEVSGQQPADVTWNQLRADRSAGPPPAAGWSRGWSDTGYTEPNYPSADSAQAKDSPRDPVIVRWLRLAADLLRDNRQWALGAAVAVALIVGIAGSLGRRR
jgi:hypothetical protein